MSIIDYKTLRSRATDLEALEERARRLFTVPPQIAKGKLDAMSADCKNHLVNNPPHFYKLVGNQYVLQKAVSEIALADRLEILECLELPNGIKLLSVVDITNDTATLELHFYNRNYLATKIFKKYSDEKGTDPSVARHIFSISGGHRLPAGAADGQVQVTTISTSTDETVLVLEVKPVGDYSTYKLSINTSAFPATDKLVIDPVFNEIDFKFRPGCFNINCAPDWTPAPQPNQDPVIDYLAKDYDSFRHAMIAAMMQRVPNWEPSSEADLDQVLLELFSAAADELSDYQDRVMNEAYLSSARKRVSLARHARLMDYHIHQGNQASTWLALEVALDVDSAPLKSATVEYFLAENFEVWAGAEQKSSSSVIFLARESQRVHQLVNSMSLYTWGDAIPSLLAGDTSADLKIWLVDINDFATDKASAIAVQELIRSGTIKRLLIQEHLNPATGTVNGYNPHKRQLLELLPGNDGAEAMYDPTTAPAGYDPAADPPNSAGQGQWFVRVRWEERDKLKSNYCFIVDCPDTGKVENVSLFHGNLVEVTHGRSRFADPAKLLPKDQPVDDRQVIFKEPTESLTDSNQFHFERTERWGALCPLPDYNIAYLNTPPGGDVPPQSTLQVTVVQNGGGSETWREVPSLIHSDDSDENGAHFIVETDEEGLSYVRFGSGTNGKELPENATVTCAYQVGNGLEGNIGFDTLIHFNPAANNFLKLDNKNPQPKDTSSIIGCWNPFDITNGRSPEPAAEIIRRAPEAYRIRQLRAVTLQDYIRRAEELPEVSRAAARYSWTGSWRTVRITIDPAGTNVLEEDLRRKIARYLDAVRLIGEDLEIRPPQFVPLEIHVSLCAKPDFWPEDLRSILEQEFSDGWTPDGRMGFFHPDLWTFGQSLMASQITDRVLRVAGVEHIISVTMKRWNYPTSATTEITDVAYNEIIQVLNDPDHMEQGFIDFDVRGGRR